MGGRGKVREGGPRDREDRGEPRPATGQAAAANRVDGAMDSVETPGCHARAHPARAEAEPDELVEPDQAVLPFGDRGDLQIEGNVASVISSFRSPGCHREMVGHRNARMAPPMCRSVPGVRLAALGDAAGEAGVNRAAEDA